MKNIKILWSIIILLLAIIAGAGYKFVTGSTVEAEDGRVAIILTKGERNFVLGEMRSLLGHMQQLVTAAAEKDMDKTIKIAKILTDDSKGETQVSIIAKTPLGFKKISSNIHAQFAELYNESLERRDPDHALKQVSIIMQNCIACHGAYRLADIKE